MYTYQYIYTVPLLNRMVFAPFLSFTPNRRQICQSYLGCFLHFSRRFFSISDPIPQLSVAVADPSVAVAATGGVALVQAGQQHWQMMDRMMTLDQQALVPDSLLLD
jgi:hypothetical protein